MKKALFVFPALALIIASCNLPQKQENYKAVSNVDTTGLAEFQSWKAAQIYHPLYYGLNPASNSTQQVEKRVVYYYPSHRPVHHHVATYNRNGGYMKSQTSNSAKAIQKRGWSMAAKDAAIGGGGGALLGAIINRRNPLVGGVIGGIVGGAVGYGLGHAKDKSNGRY